jgi:serine/threonine-protein kinase
VYTFSARRFSQFTGDAMIEIRLSRGVWRLNEASPLGPAGGFGEVFWGEGSTGPVAIKRLKITADAAAHREMNIGQVLAGRELGHVVPVLDFGQDANSDRYYLVMPICDRTLQDWIGKCGPLSWEEAKGVALDIISGLAEVGDIVHRDLKPANVLCHEGRWKIADFGIAKFVQDVTSIDTLRSSLTPTYAAPEQWRGERPTGATDVYALGCMLHAMINGRPPFLGSVEDIMEGHLSKEPPALNGVDQRLEGFARLMLRKTAENRPSLERCRKVISELSARPLRPGSHALAAAGAKVVQAELAAESARRAEEDVRQSRKRAAEEAVSELRGILDRLFDEIVATSEIVNRADRSIKLGAAELAYDQPITPAAIETQSGWDVLAASILRVGGRVDRQAYHQPEFYVYNATLAYAKIPSDSSYRWREVSFFNWAIGKVEGAPVALRPDSPEFHLALSMVASGWQTAFGPTPIDGEDEDAFADRWIKLFTKAVSGRLNPPNSLPLSPSYFD